MSPDQATTLAKRIINTMRPTPALLEWQEILEPLELDAALRTFRDLRDRVDDGLSIPTFRRAYGRVTGTDPAPERRRDAVESCSHCGGCGYEAGPPEYETVYGEKHEYSTVVPCRCTRPRAASGAPAPAALFEEF